MDASGVKPSETLCVLYALTLPQSLPDREGRIEKPVSTPGLDLAPATLILSSLSVLSVFA